ncbi:MAG: methyltransferase domain-containing protein [Chloroflexi bacterium]|nr:methyltransferase domain-containing protein [Chloroflexota bacterium]
MTNFDERAKAWDSDPKKVKRAFDVANAIRELIPLSREMTAFEYGCGTGLLSFELKDEFRQITLADTSQGMLEVLKEKISVSGVTNMNTLRLDLIIDPIPAEKFNITYSLLTLHHIHDVHSILRKFHELLLPHGILLIADLDKEDGSFHTDETEDVHKGFSRSELHTWVEETGFEDVRFSTAHVIRKEIAGIEKEFPVFLLHAKKV